MSFIISSLFLLMHSLHALRSLHSEDNHYSHSTPPHYTLDERKPKDQSRTNAGQSSDIESLSDRFNRIRKGDRECHVAIFVPVVTCRSTYSFLPQSTDAYIAHTNW